MPANESRLEKKFAFLWRCLDGPPLEREFKFHPKRKWRADFAHLEAVLAGWRVVRLTERQLEADSLERLIALLAGAVSIPPVTTESSRCDPIP